MCFLQQYLSVWDFEKNWWRWDIDRKISYLFTILLFFLIVLLFSDTFRSYSDPKFILKTIDISATFTIPLPLNHPLITVKTPWLDKSKYHQSLLEALHLKNRSHESLQEGRHQEGLCRFRLYFERLRLVAWVLRPVEELENHTGKMGYCHWKLTEIFYLIDTDLGRWLWERLNVTRSPLSFWSGSCHSSGWWGRLQSPSSPRFVSSPRR